MALKFNCPNCNSEITVKYLSPGEEAKCYSCGSHVTVPENAETVDSESSVLLAARTPVQTESQSDYYTVIPRFGEALSFAWQVIKKNYDLSIGIAVIYFVAMLGASLSQVVIGEFIDESVFQFLLATLVSGIIITVARAGLFKIALGFAFDQTAKPIDFRSTLKQYIRCFIGSYIYVTMIILGLAFLIIPGIILAVRFQFYDFFILRYDMTLIESFKRSAKLTKNYRTDLFGFNIVAILFGSLGLIACCIGVYVTFPIATVAWAHVFGRLIKEKDFDVEFAAEEMTEGTQAESEEVTPAETLAYPSIAQAIMLVLLYMVLQVFMFMPVGIFEGITDIPLMEFYPLEIALNIIVVILITWFIIKKSGQSLKELASLNYFNLWLILPVTLTFVGIGIAASELDNVLTLILPKAEWYKDIGEHLRSSLLGFILLAVVFAPPAEEFIFRGVIVEGFKKNYSFKKTVLVSALLFAFIHLNPWQFVSAFFGGVVLAWLFIETRSLIPCIYAHALYNGFDLILTEIFHIRIPGFTISDPDRVLFQPWWFDLLGIVLIAGGVSWLYIIFSKRSSNINNTGDRDSGDWRID